MQYLTKEENKKAYDAYLFGNRQTNVSLSADEMIQMLKENFVCPDMTNEEKGKLKETVCFTVGADRASFNREQTYVIMCEMPSNITLGLTRSMTIVDLNTKTGYNLKMGMGYKKIKKFVSSL